MESHDNIEIKVNNDFSNGKAPIPAGQPEANIVPNVTQDKNIQKPSVELAVDNNYDKNNQNNIDYNNMQYNKNDKIEDLKISSTFIKSDFFINYDLTSKFLMKVYGILLFQFIIIFALVLIFQINAISDYIKKTPAFYWTIFGISLTAIIIILGIFMCNPNLLRRVPANYITLFILTLFLGLFCAFIASFYKLETVLCAITCVIAISLGSFCVGLFDKGDGLKFWYLLIGSVSCLVIHYGIMALIFRSYYLNFLYCHIVAIFYSLYIAFDTLVIKETYSIDDYILGAIILTLDIVRLFLFLLRLFGGGGSKK